MPAGNLWLGFLDNDGRREFFLVINPRGPVPRIAARAFLGACVVAPGGAA